jgi:hypothetical protein
MAMDSVSWANVQAHPRGGAAGSSNEGVKRALGAVGARSAGTKITALLVALLWQLAATVTSAVELGASNATPEPHRVGCSALFGLMFSMGFISDRYYLPSLNRMVSPIGATIITSPSLK